jgi:hypothetical protein
MVPEGTLWMNAEGPETVEQMLEGLVRSHQVWFELSIGHRATMPQNASKRHTRGAKNGWPDQALTPATAVSYGPPSKK